VILSGDLLPALVSLAMLVISDPPPAAPPTTEIIQVTERLTTLLYLVTLIGVVLLTLLFIFALQRRRERTRRLELDRERALRAQPQVSAWEEAGRRMQVPGPHDDINQLDVRTDDERSASPSPTSSPPPQSRSIRQDQRPSIAAAASRVTRPVVLITGAAKRVGRATALEFARCGFDIVFTYHHSEQDAQDLTHLISRLGRQATCFRVSLNDLEAVEALATQLAQTLPRLDVLVHNAASYAPSPLAELDAADAERQLRVNAVTPLLLTARLAPLLSASTLEGGGSVIAMLDAHAQGRPRRNYAAYMMSKAALAELVYSLAKDLAPRVRVNGVAPGVVAWEETSNDSAPEPPEGSEFDSEGSKPPEFFPQPPQPTHPHQPDTASSGAKPPHSDEQQRYMRRIPLGRFGEPDDAAKMVRWLATEAKYVTGQIIRVDGGRWLT